MTSTFSLGDITINRIVEQETPFWPALEFLPGLTAERLEENRAWLSPKALEPQTDQIILCFQSYIVRTPHHTVLVDSCIGNDKERPHRPNWHLKRDDTYMRGLAALGLSVADIDVVMCTHLHPDHVGWNTRLKDGRWVPTFPNARYLFSEVEFAHWTAQHAKEPVPAFADSVLPVVGGPGRARAKRSRRRRPRPPLADAGAHAGAFRRARRQGRRCGGADRRPHPLAAAGALSRAVDALRLRSRPRRDNPPCVPRALLRHAHLVLHGALPVALGRTPDTLGRRFPLRPRRGVT
jgi:Metallo-beta-lactamase superfamily